MSLEEEQASVLGFSEAVNKNLAELEARFEHFFPSLSFASATQASPIFGVDLSDASIAQQLDDFLKHPNESASTPFKLSVHLSKAAVDAWDQGSVEQAWFLLSQARYFSGMAYASVFGTERFMYEVVNANAIKGAASRSQKSDAAQQQAAKLIREVASKRRSASAGEWPGWGSRQEAADAISEDMRTFLKRSGSGLKPGSISQRVYVWMREDERVRSAFNETCAEGETYTPQKRRDWEAGWEGEA